MSLKKQYSHLKNTYNTVKKQIEERIAEFETVRKRGDEKEFCQELLFCLLTPQSRASFCWQAACLIQNLSCGGKNKDAVLSCLSRVRFKYTKAERIVHTLCYLRENSISLPEKLENFSNSSAARKWVVKTFPGIGWKEGSHFLRNTGIGLDLAIVDRHIIRMLVQIGVMKAEPRSISYQKYLEIENQIRSVADALHIPMSHLDLLFWYIQTGTIFK